MKRLLSILIVVILIFTVACDSEGDEFSSSVSYTDIPTETDRLPSETLKIGYSPFSGLFNPFYTSYASDRDVVSLTSVSLVTFDFEGNVVFDAAGKSSNNDDTESDFTGIANISTSYDEQGNEIIVISLRKDVKFSDGTVLDIDDVIFSMYVLADPKYEGPSLFNTLPIKGIYEYRDIYDTLYQVMLNDSVDESNVNIGNLYTEEKYTYCINAFNKAGNKYVSAIFEDAVNNFTEYDVETVADVAKLYGYTLDVNAGADDFWSLIVESCRADIDIIGEIFKSVSFENLLLTELGNRAEEFCIKLRNDNDVSRISGIERIDSYNMKIYLTEKDYNLYEKLSIIVAPLHYYGSASLYDYENSKFGFEKGSLDFLEEKSNAPMGAGPYCFLSYKDGVVKFERNKHYYNGTPNSKFVELIELGDKEKVDRVLSGDIHLATTSYNKDTLEKLTDVVSDPNNAEKIKSFEISKNGYGYIGISANNVSVGKDKCSNESKYLRKAFATLFSAYKYEGVIAYFGEDITTEYPMHSNSPAYPENPIPAFAFDSDGRYIYTEEMDELARYNAALMTAKDYFIKAGFMYSESEAEFISAPDGSSLVFEIMMPLENYSHPSYKIVSDVKYALSTLGITLNITAPESIEDFWDGVYNGKCMMWAAGIEYDGRIPVVLDSYHSANNKFGVSDNKLDSLLEMLPEVSNSTIKYEKIAEICHLVRDWAVEVPLYDSNDILIVNSEFVDMKVFAEIHTNSNVINVVDKIRLIA